jgi:hypothetical protein
MAERKIVVGGALSALAASAGQFEALSPQPYFRAFSLLRELLGLSKGIFEIFAAEAKQARAS